MQSNYNTRRKSVSLSRLGIHIPQSHGPRASSHRPPPASTVTGATASSPTASAAMPPPPSADDQPPAKKCKRSNSSPSRPKSSPAASKAIPINLKNAAAPAGGRIAETTPPPSPRDATGFKIDTQGINDEIVVAVIEQLERTGNRPHLLKELAAVLQHTIPIVQTSANQPAIISSRLTNYMKRTWTALAPCPLGKELVGTHPKRIYFFLAGHRRQPFPESPEVTSQPRIISPSLTSGENEEEDPCDRRRSEMSPSPEVDLSSTYFEDEASATTAFPSLYSHHSSHNSQSSLSHRRTSPPLEGDEREFTQTASSLQQRKHSQAAEKPADLPMIDVTMDDIMTAFDCEDAAEKRCKADAAALFGAMDSHLSAAAAFSLASSPLLRPLEKSHDVAARAASPFVWGELKRSDTVELDELDDLFESC